MNRGGKIRLKIHWWISKVIVSHYQPLIALENKIALALVICSFTSNILHYSMISWHYPILICHLYCIIIYIIIRDSVIVFIMAIITGVIIIILFLMLLLPLHCFFIIGCLCHYHMHAIIYIAIELLSHRHCISFCVLTISSSIYLFHIMNGCCYPCRVRISYVHIYEPNIFYILWEPN